MLLMSTVRTQAPKSATPTSGRFCVKFVAFQKLRALEVLLLESYEQTLPLLHTSCEGRKTLETRKWSVEFCLCIVFSLFNAFVRRIFPLKFIFRFPLENLL